MHAFEEQKYSLRYFLWARSPGLTVTGPTKLKSWTTTSAIARATPSPGPRDCWAARRQAPAAAESARWAQESESAHRSQSQPSQPDGHRSRASARPSSPKGRKAARRPSQLQPGIKQLAPQPRQLGCRTPSNRSTRAESAQLFRVKMQSEPYA
jgi:hypothetical protein